jgi:hypothetical protein
MSNYSGSLPNYSSYNLIHQRFYSIGAPTSYCLQVRSLTFMIINAHSSFLTHDVFDFFKAKVGDNRSYFFTMKSPCYLVRWGCCFDIVCH